MARGPVRDPLPPRACERPATRVFFAGQALVAVSLLEAVNYIEHYGLQRQRGSDGRLEPVTHHHSWNAAERVSNAWLFNLQRHADQKR